MKAADLQDEDVLRAVYELNLENDSWTNTRSVTERFPHAPFKVVQAKLRQLYNRSIRLVEGCPCGCRGDWELTPAGYELIGVVPWRIPPYKEYRTETS